MAIPINSVVDIHTESRIFLLQAQFVSMDDFSINVIIPHHSLASLLAKRLYVLLTSDVHGLMPYYCEVSMSSIQPAITEDGHAGIGLSLDIMGKENNVQRRRDIKVKTHFEATAGILGYGMGRSERPTCFGFIKDISATGMLYVTRERLAVGQEISVMFEEISPAIELIGKIVRIQKEENEAFGYGCAFVNLDDTQTETMRQFVYRIQLQQRRTPVLE